MKHNRLFPFIALLIAVNMVLSACGPTTTPTAAPTTAPTQAAAPTTAPTQAAAPTEAPTQAAAPTTAPTQVAAPTTAPTTAAAGADTIIIGTTDTVASMDPADAYSIRDWEMITNISQGLVSYKPGTIDVQPELATAMPDISADGLSYTFTLKTGIKFGDGTDLIEFDKRSVRRSFFDAPRNKLGVGHENIVSDDLDLVAERFCKIRKTFPVMFGKGIFP